MELELAVLDKSGDYTSGGVAEVTVGGGIGPVNEQELLITILLLLFLTVVFSLSRTGQAIFNAIDSFGRSNGGRVIDGGGGGGAEFTVENR